MKKENKTKADDKATAIEAVAEVEKEEKEIQVNQDKVGSLMHEARLKKGLKISDASKDLCIRASYLEAIEAGNYDEIPEPPYGIGFIRSYADYLGLNAARMVQLFKEETDAASKNSDYYVMEPQTEANAPNKKSLIISMLAIIAVYVGWFVYNQNQNKPEEAKEQQEYSAEMSDTTEAYPLQVEDYVSVEESGVELPAEEESIPVVDVKPVKDGESGNVTVSEESFVPETSQTEAVVSEEKTKNEQTTKSEEPKKEEVSEVKESEAPKKEIKATEKNENKSLVSNKKPGSRVTIKIKGGENWLEVKDAEKLYISKVLKDGDVYEVPAGEGMILSVGRYEGAEVYVDGKLTEVVKPNKKTGIALDPFLDSANH